MEVDTGTPKILYCTVIAGQARNDKKNTPLKYGVDEHAYKPVLY